MKQARLAGISVRIVRSAMEYMGQQTKFQALDVPPRSRLYGLVPCNIETIWSESLTSYLNRLGWAHGVSPRDLVVQEMLPFLSSKPKLSSSPGWLPTFSGKGGAISLNGMRSLALE